MAHGKKHAGAGGDQRHQSIEHHNNKDYVVGFGANPKVIVYGVRIGTAEKGYRVLPVPHTEAKTVAKEIERKYNEAVGRLRDTISKYTHPYTEGLIKEYRKSPHDN